MFTLKFPELVKLKHTKKICQVRKLMTHHLVYGISIEFLGDHTNVFQSPSKRFCPRPIATKFSPVIDYELKFVKMQFLVKSISLWQQ